MNRLLGGISLAAGILVAGGSGICSAGVLADMYSARDALIVLLFGGVPFAAGMLLTLCGWALLRSSALADREFPDEIE